MSTQPAPAPKGETYDYIVVGAASAGFVLARGLSDNSRHRVLLHEAGPGTETFWIRTLDGVRLLFHDPALNWKLSTQPEPGMVWRQLFWPRGEVVGSTSAIDGMIYICGDQQDYDDWAVEGNAGWSYRDVLPYFRRSEANEDGANEWRGDSGPLKVTTGLYRNTISAAFIRAANAGVRRTPTSTGRPRKAPATANAPSATACAIHGPGLPGSGARTPEPRGTRWCAGVPCGATARRRDRRAV